MPTKVFSDIFGATGVALLTQFAAELREMTQDRPAHRIAGRGRGRLYDPDANARTVQQAWRTSYPIDHQMNVWVTPNWRRGRER